MEHEDYPGLYQETDEASITAQARYLAAIRLYLSLLIVAAACSLFLGESRCLAVCAALIFLTTLFLSILLAVKRYDKTWYNARAVAESVKTVTWRYMMQAEPYDGDNADARPDFIKDLQDILAQNKELARVFTGDKAATGAISPEMERIRELPRQDRMRLYLTDRIDEQRDWYCKKAGQNKRQASHWFILMCLSQAFALLFVSVRIAKPTWSHLPVDICIVCACAALTWIQVKRFQELATAFSLTAHEISLLRGYSQDVSTDAEFSDFVNDAENAFSREHTQWQARRQT
ncbi:MAG TPA: DUF4231 domain-containing protein [Marinobacter sp.]|uniref:SMODS and SLOG-associating 2TM effector domain-containing protein n=1 Tax=marine sediment metagenome TaxID=412755 RepID=A0A0F9M008_9ZZZZ|nr:DUF4231 domain-containing protein [Marinobacter sp.]